MKTSSQFPTDAYRAKLKPKFANIEYNGQIVPEHRNIPAALAYAIKAGKYRGDVNYKVVEITN